MHLFTDSLLDWLRTHAATSSLLAALLVGYAIYCICNKVSHRHRLPPGPWISLPFVGHLPFLEASIKGFDKMQKKYGPIYRLQLGQRSVLVLSDFAMIKEAFSHQSYSDRSPSPPNQVLVKGCSISTINGIEWLDHKRFALHALRDLGFGKVQMEAHIKEEISFLLDELDSFEGSPTDVRRYLAPSVSNNICALLFGRRLDYHDPMRLTLDWAINEYVRSLSSISLCAWFPWIKAYMLKFGMLNYNNLQRALEQLENFFEQEIDKHQASLDPNSIRDYLDAYLLQMEQNGKDSNTSFTRTMLLGNAVVLMSGGTNTTRYTIEWTLLTMAKHQDIQERVYAEIKEIIGKERMPQWADHKEMPFTKAALLEILRWKTLIPINLHRYTTEPSEVGGYFIPKSTTVLANFYAVHNDPSHWDKPEVYNPYRFLSPDGTKVVKDEHLISFSLGRRMCPGETLAHIEVFLYVTSILQRFKVSFPSDNVHNFEGKLGLLYEPNPYKFCMIPREN